MTTQMFHIGDILSVIWCRVLSPRGISGVYELLDFLAGKKLPTYELSKACNGSRLILVFQLPDLASDEIDVAVKALDESMKHRMGRGELGKILADWLAPLVAKHGEMFEAKIFPGGMFEVKAIPGNVLLFREPVAEAVSHRL